MEIGPKMAAKLDLIRVAHATLSDVFLSSRGRESEPSGSSLLTTSAKFIFLVLKNKKKSSSFLSRSKSYVATSSH